MRYRVGDLVLDLGQVRLVRGEMEIELSQLSFRLLAALVKAAPGWVSIDSLISQVWPGLVVGPETVVQRVKLVREALDDPAKSPRYIAAARGYGYRIVAPVTQVLAADAAALVGVPVTIAESASTPRGDDQDPVAERATHTRRASVSRALVFAGAAVAALVTVAVLVTSLARVNVTPEGARVAVLPFENLSPNPDDAFFADGLHHEVIAAIAERAPTLSVISRTTMMSYSSRPRARVADIAKELGAAYVVEGTVLRTAGRVHLTVNLVDARGETSAWSSVYDRDAAGALALRSEVASAIVDRIPAANGGRHGAATELTNDPDAYDFYLKALTARNDIAGDWFAARERMVAVERLFTSAIAIDSTFAAAYAERAALRTGLVVRNFDTSTGLVSAIERDLEAAERLAPNAAKTLAARAFYLMFVAGDYAGAAAAFSGAEARGLADPMWMLDMAIVLRRLGRNDDGLRLLEHALTIDPANPVAALYYASYLASEHRVQEALRTLDVAIEKYPADARLLVYRSELIFVGTGRSDEFDSFLEQRTLFQGLFVANDVNNILYNHLRRTGRFQELRDALAVPPSVTGRSTFAASGDEPVARYRGWVDLLRGDRAAATEDGRAVLEFLASTEETAPKRWFRRLLAAEAYTFTGETSRAVRAARESAALGTPLCCSEFDAQRSLAAVYAWSGAHDEAVDFLTHLADGSPGLGPAEIAREPLFAVPLAHDVRFRALVDRLEASMRQSSFASAASVPGRSPVR